MCKSVTFAGIRKKITDIRTTSIDYDITAHAAKRFFATVRGKLYWAIHGQTTEATLLSTRNS